MEDGTDLRNLMKVVDEAQEQNLLFTQNTKAQKCLLDRQRQEAKKQKEACKYISSENRQLEVEIKQAEQVLKSLTAAHETIRSTMVEKKKELLLAKERKMDIAKRVELGEKKYEELWLQCKQRFESIPFNKKYFELKNETQELMLRAKSLDHEAIILVQEIKKKKDTLQQQDNSRIIELAQYMIHERPKMLKDLAQKREHCRKLTAEIAYYEKEETKAKDGKHKEKAENPSNEHLSDVGVSIQMSKLTQPDKELEMFTVNLDQVTNEQANPMYFTIQDGTPPPLAIPSTDDDGKSMQEEAELDYPTSVLHQLNHQKTADHEAPVAHYFTIE